MTAHAKRKPCKEREKMYNKIRVLSKGGGEMKRTLCALLAALMLLAAYPMGALAAPTVYFTSVNDTLLELSDETMPFWSDNRLYVSYSSAWKTDFGISYSYNKNTKKAIFYQHQQFLVCDFEENTISDNDGGSYAGAPLDRGGLVFVPVAALVEYFDLEYSYTKIDQGHLVRITNDEVVLSDARFIEAAAAPIQQRYERYEKSLASEQEPQKDPVDEQPNVSERRNTEAYLALTLTDAEAAARVLDAFGTSSRLTLIFTGAQIKNGDKLLRRAVGMGNSVALQIDGSQGESTALSQAEELNAALWQSASVKTRFVRVQNATDEVEQALADAGYCCVKFTADLSTVTDSSRIASRILSAAQRSGRAVVLLGTDTKMENRASTVLRALREGNCRSLKLKETVL